MGEMRAAAIAAVQRRVSHITHMAESRRTHPLVAQPVSYHARKVCVWTQRKGWGMGKHGVVVRLATWRRQSVGKLGPVLNPISGAKAATADASQLLNGGAPVSWYATGSPVGDGLHGFTKGVGQALQAELLDCGLKGGGGCHACSLHASCTLSTRIVSTYPETLGMEEDPVWPRINEELDRRKVSHKKPSTWAALGAMFGASSQTTTNWKTRGVPPKHYADIAQALGWTMEELLSTERPATAQGDPLEAPYQKVYKLLTDEQRRAVYAHALELALNLSPEDAIRAADTAAGLAGTGRPRGRGQHKGGMDTNYGDLPEQDTGKVSGGTR